MNFAKYRVQLSTEKKYSSKYEYEYSIPDPNQLADMDLHCFQLCLKSQACISWNPTRNVSQCDIWPQRHDFSRIEARVRGQSDPKTVWDSQGPQGYPHIEFGIPTSNIITLE